MNERIRVCDCGAPLLSCMEFFGCEWYCLMCGKSGGLLGTGETVDNTPELQAKHDMFYDVLQTIRKYTISDGAYKRGCSMCNGFKEQHWRHASNNEKMNHKIGRDLMRKIASEDKSNE